MSNYSDNKLADDQNTAWAQVINLVQPDWKLFDVGCSSGNLGEELIKKKNCTVDGIEIDPEDAQLAKKKLRHVEMFNIETDTQAINSSFKEKYDAILFVDVIEHLVDPVQVLKDVRSMLKAGGIIIFSIPNMAHVSIRLALLEGEFTYTKAGLLDETHLHFYTEKQVRKVFTEAGYGVGSLHPSSLQYALDLYKIKLGEAGLTFKNKQKFLDMINDTYGNVYQFVGLAQPSQTKKITQPATPKINPHERDHEIMQQTFTGYKDHIKYLEKSVKLKDDHIRDLETIIQDLKNRTVRAQIKEKVKDRRRQKRRES